MSGNFLGCPEFFGCPECFGCAELFGCSLGGSQGLGLRLRMVSRMTTM